MLLCVFQINFQTFPFLCKMQLIPLLLLLLLLALAQCERRHVARVGLLAPVEQPEAESLLRRAVAAFNSRSTWLLIQPVLVTISDEDPLLR